MKKYIIIFIILIAFYFRYTASLSELWFDEVYTYKISQFNSIISILKWVRTGDFCPPLIFIQAHLLKFTDNPLILRTPSIILSLLSIILVYLITKDLSFNIRIYASFLTAFSPFMITYGADTRMYSYFLFFSLLACFFEQKEYNIKNTIFLGLAFSGGLYSHYFFGFAILSILSFEIYYFKKLKTPAFFASIIAFILYIPWIPSIFSQLSIKWPSIAPIPNIHIFFSTILDLFMISFNKNINIFFETALIITIIIIGIKSSSTYLKKRSLFFICSIFFIFLIALKTRTFTAKYIIYSAPHFYIIFAIGIENILNEYFNHFNNKLLIGILVCILVCSTGFSYSIHPFRINYSKICQYIDHVKNENEYILVSLADRQIIMKFYAEKNNLISLKNKILAANKKNIDTLNKKNIKNFWLVIVPYGNYETQKNSISMISKKYKPIIERYQDQVKIIKFARIKNE